MSELDRKMMKTPDLNRERLEELKRLFPDLFTAEGRLNPNELKNLVDPGLEQESERFEFRWFGKNQARRNAFTPGKATLVYDESRSVNPELADGNMIIEGENLETLKVLLSAYRGKVKCIYIDPPYNTGKDFVYSDRWKEKRQDYWEHIGVVNDDGLRLETNPEASGRFHSNWMNMLYPRLLLARQLLREDGAICISINDNEVHHLRKICDEVFGEENFVNQFIWESKKAAQGMATQNMVVANHEYILVYAKLKESFQYLGLERDEIAFANPDNDPRGPWKRQYLQRFGQNLPERSIRDPDTGRRYSFETPYTQEKLERWVKEGRIIFPADGRGYPARREFLNEYEHNQQLITSLGLYPTKSSTEKLYALFDNVKIFPNPKPYTLLLFLFEALATDGDIILDFFAGSGSSAQALTELNRKDGGRRSYILVQLPEATDPHGEACKAGYKKISDITIERSKRVIANIEKEAAEKNLPLSDDGEAFKTGFKVYKLAKSHFPRVDFAPDPEKTEAENIALLETYIKEKEASFEAFFNEHEIFDEVLLKTGFMLNYTKEREGSFSGNAVYRVKDNYKECLICLEMAIRKETLKELENFADTVFICLERALDTGTKWNLRQRLGDKFVGV